MPILHRLSGAFLDLLLPRRCAGCGVRESWICPDCAATLARLPAARCRVCAIPLTGTLICPSCYRDPPRYDALHAPFLHDGLARDLVHALKYRGQRHLAEPLAHAAAAALPAAVESESLSPAYDLIAPVPLHASRRRERGFNQSELLARHLAETIGPPVLPELLERSRATEAQTQLRGAPARFANVRGAFAVRGDCRGARILLVDDVCTTGATLEACAAALKRAGATQVDALVVTRTATHP
jgi:ComF family protein